MSLRRGLYALYINDLPTRVRVDGLLAAGCVQRAACEVICDAMFSEK